MAEEIELKLSIAPDQAKRLCKRLPLQEMKKRGPDGQRLVSVYFDTPGLDLRRRGIGLRVRHIGGQRLQTIKCAGDSPLAVSSAKKRSTATDLT